MISTKVSGLDNKTKALVIQGQGLSNRLMKEVRHLIHIRGLCHLYNLVCEKAIGELPIFIIEFIKQVCSYFDKGLRDNRPREIQSEAGVKKPISILGFIKIRWTSLLSSVERILDLWPFLEKYFQEEECLLGKKVQDPEYHLYSYLVYILLHKLMGYTIYFQDPHLLYDEIEAKIREGYLLFRRCYLKSNTKTLTSKLSMRLILQIQITKTFRKWYQILKILSRILVCAILDLRF